MKSPVKHGAGAAARNAWQIFLIFLRLGLTSFGGPVAHLGYFHEEFVNRRRWLGERAYADLVALCQFLPGPASSQVGIALGLSRGGYAGALAAWAGFTLPSAIALIASRWVFRPGATRFRRACSIASKWSPWRSSHKPSGAWRELYAPTRRAFRSWSPPAAWSLPCPAPWARSG
jgi:hypothetical protein